ncbi:MAG: UPF0158 family protein [Kiloniellales bacterium]
MSVVSLRKILDQLDLLTDQGTLYVNRATGEVYVVTDDDISAAESEDTEWVPEWQKDELPKIREILSSEDWLELATKFDIHEYAIMERFCLSVEPVERSDRLIDAIKGRGAFRRFKDAIHRMGIADDWYRFRDQALAEFATDCLEAQGIPFKNDL